MSSARLFALIPAAGVGARLGAATPKQYLPICGKPMLSHVLAIFAASPLIAHAYVVVSTEDEHIDDMLAKSKIPGERITVVRNGGRTRRDTVLNGLQALAAFASDDDWILVHDAARPGLTNAMIERLAAALAGDAVGGLLAMPVVDTVKQSQDGRAVATLPRERLWCAQTPQMFRHALLKQALESAEDVTDEASAIERLGLQPKLVQGSARNLKVTLPADVAIAELLMKGPE